MGAGVIAPGDKRVFAAEQPGHGVGNIGGVAQAGRVGRRPDQHKVIVHHRPALYAMARAHKFFLGGRGMRQDKINIAVSGQTNRLAGADRDHIHLNVIFFLKRRIERAQQAGIFRARGGGQF